MSVIALTVLRVLIGWHFLYEGLIKLVNPGWSSLTFLAGSKGPFSGIFKFPTSNNTSVDIIDFLNIWGLILIGISLIIGLFSRWACLAGILLLGMYYLSYPPFIGVENISNEGNYLIVNKNLIEMTALWVLYHSRTEKIYGLQRLLIKNTSHEQ